MKNLGSISVEGDEKHEVDVYADPEHDIVRVTFGASFTLSGMSTSEIRKLGKHLIECAAAANYLRSVNMEKQAKSD